MNVLVVSVFAALAALPVGLLVRGMLRADLEQPISDLKEQ